MEYGQNQQIEECSTQLRTLIYKEDFNQLKTLLDGFDWRKRKECVDHWNLGSTALYKACELDRYPFIKYFVEECNADVNIPSSTGFPPLYVACCHGDITLCEFLINHGADIHWTDSDNRSYLMIFIDNGALCRFLISKGVDISHTDRWNRSAFCHALFKSALSSLEILIKCGINPNGKIYGYRLPEKVECGLPVKIACANSNAELLDFLICHGADIHDNNDMSSRSYLMIYITNHKICEVLIQHGQNINHFDISNQTALHTAVIKNAINTLPLLLKNGADVNVLDVEMMSPLHLAVIGEKFDFVLPLLSCGSDPNSRDGQGRSVLQSTLKAKNITCLNHLLHYGANVNSKDMFGMTDFHFAIKENIDISYYTVLLKFGAEINSQTNKGVTPLHMSVQNIDTTCCKFLLTYGADVNMADEDGQTPLHYAVKYGTPELITLLCKYGADANVVDKDDMGPIQEATILKRNEIVKVLLQDLKVNNGSKIDCYELMAAENFYQEEYEEGCNNLRTALTLRQANHLISKPTTVVNSVLGNIREPETYQDLMSLDDDNEVMLKQATVIKARIFGPWSSSVLEMLNTIDLSFDDELENGEHQLFSEAILSFVEAAIRRGFSTNLVREEDGSTPLHMLLLALENDGLKIDSEYVSVVKLFQKNGTHLCKTDSTGFSILERLSELNYPVCKVRDRTLQCLAAEVIVESKIPYEGEVPSHLIPFIKDHKEYSKYMFYGRSPLHPIHYN
ncbi:hypothetical protein KUTeg_019686 [Tegillarca granosa]|uniref:Uncharacterized protein n=1 Tax=Tegillarca granosa TaxID=220873 RepID=A0ABQ9EDS3_TEGGR|nr:hypothetical protein KUTeg_019686 [Tegillarca granosa]